MEKQKTKQGLARLFEIAGQRKGLLVLAGVLSAASAACMLVPYWAVYRILTELLENAGDTGGIDAGLLVKWGWIAFLGLVGGLILLYAALMASHVAAFRILYGLRVRLSEHIGRLPLGYLNGTSTGAIKKTMEQNIEKIENFIAHTIPDMVNVVATVVLMFAIFFSLDGWLAAVGLAVIAVSVILQFSNFMGKKAQEFTRIYFDAQERMSASAVQYVRGMPVVKIFGQSVRSFRQFNAEIEAYKTYALKVCDTYQPGMVAFTVLLNSLVTFFFPIGILLVGGSPGDIALAAVWLFFIVMGPGVASPVYKLMYLGGGTREINEGVVRIDRIFDRRPVPEPAEPRVPTTYDIEFRHVGFSYSNEAEATRTEALRDISFTARQGEITALVGPSGSGKSTVANLIPRFWDVGQGEIRIECHEFIERLPDGYATRIGDRGVYLSGGEAQRVCVARAILKNAPVLVLDEATAFADPENEWKMQQALQHLIRDKTVIIIAHRLSSIVAAQQILVLRQGQLVQSGRHEVLSKTDGVYKKMWDAYTDAFRWQLDTKEKRA